MSTTTIARPKVILTFEYNGRTRNLVKHPVVQQALREGTISEADARLKAWMLRAEVDGKSRMFTLSADDNTAIKEAKAHLNTAQRKPTDLRAFLDDRDAKLSVNFDTLAKEWREAGYPTSTGSVRADKSAANIEQFLASALLFWGDKRAANATSHLLPFATWRRAKAKANHRGEGSRSIDLELSAMSSLCQWATAMERIESNPFAGVKSGGQRVRFHDPKKVRHCHEFMPESDEEFHRLLSHFFNREYDSKTTSHAYKPADLAFRSRAIGAWLAFTGLVGLRPEEPQFLFRYKRIETPPPSPAKLPPGTIFKTIKGEWKMRVQRGKKGQNPYVLLHPAALDFLATWETYLDAHTPKHSLARPWFPHQREKTRPLCQRKGDFTALSHRVTEACTTLGITKLKAKGIGRAFYVRVRRSQGEDDSIIATELGQSTNGALIRSVYGNPEDLAGSALFDWLPENTAPAWETLTQNQVQPENVINL